MASMLLRKIRWMLGGKSASLADSLAANAAQSVRLSTETSAESLTSLAFRRFKKHRMATSSASILIFFIVIALAAPWIATALRISPEEQNIHGRYLPPMSRASLGASEQESRIEVFAELQPNFVREYAFNLRESEGAESIVGEVEADPIDALFQVTDILSKEGADRTAFLALNIPGTEKIEELLNSFTKTHLLGTDELGRDVLIRLIYGTRVSIGVGLVVALFAALIGLLIGTISGFFGGILDTFLMRITDSLMSIPLLPVLIVLAAIDLQKVPFLSLFVGADNESVVKLIFILCLFSWMTVARVVRGSILSIREMEYVAAARSIGASNLRIIMLHIVPNVIAPLLVAVTLNIGTAIIIEAALSFLGLGIQAPTPSWGNMLFNAQELIFEAPWLAILPGSLIFLVVVCFNFLGDGLQYAIDPKQ